MDLLTAVNKILPALGEHQVTSTTQKHPTLAIILPEIDHVRRNFITPGWWFNTFPDTRLMPSSEGFIDVPNDTLSFVPDDDSEAIVAGERFYNPKTLNYKWSGTITGTLIKDISFERLPESAAQYVLYHALVLSYATDIGLEQVVNMWERERDMALSRVEREHLRQRKYSTRRSPRWLRLQRARRG